MPRIAKDLQAQNIMNPANFEPRHTMLNFVGTRRLACGANFERQNSDAKLTSPEARAKATTRRRQFSLGAQSARVNAKRVLRSRTTSESTGSACSKDRENTCTLAERAPRDVQAVSFGAPSHAPGPLQDSAIAIVVHAS